MKNKKTLLPEEPVKCNHEGMWDSVSQLALNLKDGNILLIVTLYCSECGEVKLVPQKIDMGVKETEQPAGPVEETK